ncbi:MAG: hypothetical protein PHG14_00300 [Desulfobacter postgatei]|nr:hypothetical protein [Desulfobacter postgatei]MDD4272148.1 hypothetical protein [Desulfobacter postgatei]
MAFSPTPAFQNPQKWTSEASGSALIRQVCPPSAAAKLYSGL